MKLRVPLRVVETKVRSAAQLRRIYLRGFLSALILFQSAACIAQNQSSTPQAVLRANVWSRGTVLDAAHKPVADAIVTFLGGDGEMKFQAKTDASGSFQFQSLPLGRYTITGEKKGIGNANKSVTIAAGDTQPIILVLRPFTVSDQSMEFVDNPNFTVAGVTDWTAVGGHGSDASLRTSEDLARETTTLKAGGTARSQSGAPPQELENRLLAAREKTPKSFLANHELGHFYVKTGRYRDAIGPLQIAHEIEPANSANALDLALAYKGAGKLERAQEEIKTLLAYDDTAELHRVAGDLDEKLGDPLGAVQQDELAVRMDPSEPNYFEWGSELLLHRAVRQAGDVFRNGAKAHPQSARMLAGLGAALFASAAYDEAALRLCDASDLDPAAEQPYLFLAKVEIAAPAPLPCVEPKLKRFVQLHPDDPQANYLYAMTLWKRQEVAGQTKDLMVTQKVEAILTKAVTLDNKCFEAYLQLGVIHFEQHDYPAAVDFYTKAIAVEPRLSEAHYRLGVAYDRLGQHDKARTEFQLHTEIEKEQAAAVERQRSDVKQFQIVLDSKSSPTP